MGDFLRSFLTLVIAMLLFMFGVSTLADAWASKKTTMQPNNVLQMPKTSAAPVTVSADEQAAIQLFTEVINADRED